MIKALLILLGFGLGYWFKDVKCEKNCKNK